MKLPSTEELARHRKTAFKACHLPAPKVERLEGQDVSMALSNCLLSGKALFAFPQTGDDGPVNKTIFPLGRFCRYLVYLLKNEAALDKVDAEFHIKPSSRPHEPPVRICRLPKNVKRDLSGERLIFAETI